MQSDTYRRYSPADTTTPELPRFALRALNAGDGKIFGKCKNRICEFSGSKTNKKVRLHKKAKL